MIMAEFGENLKRVREQKGITQQTLADYLYVTRQAVSRWEGGSRYPDIMTAKKMAQFLEVSLDELLSDDDMKGYVERNAILDAKGDKGLQLLLMSLAFMCSLVMAILYICNYLVQDIFVIRADAELIKYVLLTILFGYGIYTSMLDKINQKMAMVLSILYFGIFSAIAVILGFDKMGIGFLLFGVGINAVMLCISALFFAGKVIKSPVPLYIGLATVFLLGMGNLFVGMSQEIPNEILRDVILLDTFSLIGNTLVLALLAFMAHTLHKKRKLAAR